jgi:hypothetical protein
MEEYYDIAARKICKINSRSKYKYDIGFISIQ